MEQKKVLIIEDLVATQKQLSQYYDKKDIQYELCKSLLSAYEKITEIIEENKLGEYEYILMDGELNGGNTDKFITQLLSDDSVPPIISISGVSGHSDKYHLPYADKLGIINNLKYILGEEVDTNMLSEKVKDHEKYKNCFDNRKHNTKERKELLEILNHEEENIHNEATMKQNSKQSFLKKIFSKFIKTK